MIFVLTLRKQRKSMGKVKYLGCLKCDFVFRAQKCSLNSFIVVCYSFKLVKKVPGMLVSWQTCGLPLRQWRACKLHSYQEHHHYHCVPILELRQKDKHMAKCDYDKHFINKCT